MKLKSIFQKLDLFGVPITIRYQGSENHKTFFGSCVSLMILFIFIYQVFETIRSLLNYEIFSVIYQENIVESPTAFEIKPKQFTLAFGIQDKELKTFLDEQIYKVEAEFADTKRIYNNTTNQYEFVTQYIELKAIPCTQDHFLIDGTLDYFLKLPYKDLYCLPIESNISLEGQFGANIFRWLRFRIKNCSDPLSCKQKTEVEKKLDNCFLQVYYVNYAVEITDKNQPFKPIVQTNFWQPSLSQKNIYMFFRNTFINSDDGMVQQQIKKHQALLFSFDRDQVGSIQSDVMFELQIMLEKNKESQYIRKYQKLSQAISQLGGLFNFLFAVGAAFCYPFSKLVFHQKMLNQIFKFQTKKSNNDTQDKLKENIQGEKSMYNLASQQNKIQQLKQDNKKDSSDKQIGQTPLTEFIQSSPNQALQMQPKKSILLLKRDSQQDSLNQQKQRQMSTSSKLKNSEKIQKSKTITDELSSNNLKNYKNSILNRNFEQKYIQSLFKVSLNEITIKVKDIFTSFFSQRKSRQKMINYGMHKLNYQLDIQAIITKLLEIEKLKQLVLNEDQIKLFEFIPQPVIHEEMFDSKSQEDFEKAQVQNPLLKTGIFYEDRRNTLEKASDAQYAFNKIFKSQNSQVSNMDKKLLSLLDPRVSSRFDQNIFGKDTEINNPSQCLNGLQSSINQIRNQNPTHYETTFLVTEMGNLFGHQQNTSLNKYEELLGI